MKFPQWLPAKENSNQVVMQPIPFKATEKKKDLIELDEFGPLDFVSLIASLLTRLNNNYTDLR